MAYAENVMNTIPSIFNERQIRHTIVGGTGTVTAQHYLPFSVILLNRGGRYYRSTVFQNLFNQGFRSVISVELTTEAYDIENLSLRFPAVKFLIPQEEVSVGDMINMGMSECDTEFVLVIWNDVKIASNGIPKVLVDRILAEKKLCVAPVMLDQKMQMLPVQMVPAVKKKTMEVNPVVNTREGAPTMYSRDFMGIYNREKVIRQGGFDYTITTPYWQNMDFGFRAALWGEEISVSSMFRMVYESEIPQEDVTPDRSSLRFHLKNAAPQFKGDHCVLPLSKFPDYLRSSGSGPFDGWREFSLAREWVAMNKFRFVKDTKGLIELWEPLP